MKLKVFDRKKYMEAMSLLAKRNAPSYIIEAYKAGYAKVINFYYEQKLRQSRVVQESKRYKTVSESLDQLVKKAEHIPFIMEAKKRRDEDFLKAFFVMTNLDIITGKKLPPKAGRLLKDAGIYNLGLKNLYKKRHTESSDWTRGVGQLPKDWKSLSDEELKDIVRDFNQLLKWIPFSNKKWVTINNRKKQVVAELDKRKEQERLAAKASEAEE